MGTSKKHKEVMLAWAKQQSLKCQIEYEKQPKLCKQCNFPIEYPKRHSSVFCSRSCSAIHNNKSRQKKQKYVKIVNNPTLEGVKSIVVVNVLAQQNLY